MGVTAITLSILRTFVIIGFLCDGIVLLGRLTASGFSGRVPLPGSLVLVNRRSFCDQVGFLLWNTEEKYLLVSGNHLLWRLFSFLPSIKQAHCF